MMRSLMSERRPTFKASLSHLTPEAEPKSVSDHRGGRPASCCFPRGIWAPKVCRERLQNIGTGSKVHDEATHWGLRLLRPRSADSLPSCLLPHGVRTCGHGIPSI